MNAQNGTAFDSVDCSRAYDREVLTTLFGEEVGRKLFGAAVNISQRYGVDVDDVTQELALAATEVEHDYGYVNVNTACFKTRDAITKTHNYGVNRYYGSKGISVDSYDQEDSDGGDGWVLAFADEGFDWDEIDEALDVEAALDSIEDPTDRAIADGYRAGYGPVEIGNALGLNYSTVIKRRQRHLIPHFEATL